MPVAKFQMPDGQIARFQVPDGTTPDQAQSMIESYIKTQSTQSAPQQTIQDAGYNPTEGNSFLENTAIGIGKGITDIGMGLKQRAYELANKLGVSGAQQELQKIQDELAEKRRLEAPLMNTGGGKTGNFVANAVPAVASGFIPGAQGLAGTMLTGAALGAAEPTLGDESALKNAIGGAAGGAAGYGAAKLIGAGYNTAKSLIDPLYDSGKKEIIGKAFNAAAGTDEDIAKTLANLENAQSGVPGVNLTAGQAGGNTSLAALERTMSQTDPTAVNAFAGRMTEQNAARIAALEDMAGTSGQREFYAAARKQAADDLYQQAFAAGIDKKAITPEIQETIDSLLKRPSVQAAMGPETKVGTAKYFAAEDGIKLDDTTSLQGLHYVKQALDDQLAAAIKKDNPNLIRTLTDAGNKLQDVMTAISPKYAEARATFAEMSKPINQMDVAGEILDKSTNKLTGQLQPQNFARNLSDSTAASAAGWPGATLESTMTPAQLAALDAIKEDLRKTVFAQNSGRAGSDTVQKLAYANMLNATGLPNFIRQLGPSQIVGGIAARAADSVYGRANKELLQQAAETLLDPKNTAAVMRFAMSSQNTGLTGLVNTLSKNAGRISNATSAAAVSQRRADNMERMRSYEKQARAQKIAKIGQAKNIDDAIKAAQDASN